MNDYIKKAKELIQFAKKELTRAKKGNNIILAQQVCEKGYLALLRILDALFVKNGIKEEELPKTERGRIYLLRKYGNREIKREYHRIRHVLHIDGFHEAIIDYKEIKENLKDLEALTKLV